jgi:hypothetical protein
MKRNCQRIAALLILTFVAQVLMGCSTKFQTLGQFSPTSSQAASSAAVPTPVVIESPKPDFAIAQATMDFGQSQLLDLSRKSTEVSLNMSQAANASALSTQDFNQRQKMELNYQSTIVSLNITQAAATQKFIAQQTKMARDAAAAAQSTAAAATHSAFLVNSTQTAQAQAIFDAQALQTAQAVAALTAYPLTATFSAYERNVNETVQAQMILNAQATQTAQVVAALTAYPLTATPFAETKAALLLQQYGREQQSFSNQVVAPLIPILAALGLLLFILLIVLAYRRYLSTQWPRRLRILGGIVHPRPLNVIDGVIVDHDPPLHPIIPSELPPANPPRLASENTIHVEIVNATEPPVAHWIAEVEHKLATEEGLLQ